MMNSQSPAPEMAEHSNRPPAPAQNSSQRLTAPKTPVGRFAAANPVLILALAAILQGCLIATWSFVVAMKISHVKSTNLLDEGALLAAHELSHVYTNSQTFGKIGICDLDFDQTEGRTDLATSRLKIMSIHSIQEAVSRARKIGANLHNSTIEELADQDSKEVKDVEKQLCERLLLAISPSPSEQMAEEAATNTPRNLRRESPNKVYRDVYRMLAADNGSGPLKLEEINIELGRSSQSSQKWPYQSCELMPADQFALGKNDQAPYLVLLRAKYKQLDPKKANEPALERTACALISAPKGTPKRSAFIFNFPDGLPKEFHSIQSLLNYDKWAGSGDWQQVAGTEVPGRGSLAPSLQPVLPAMSPGKACSIAMYHWLRQMGTGVDDTRLALLFSTPWARPLAAAAAPSATSARTTFTPEPPNCGLVVNTGAREYAILNQTGEGGIGQVGLSRMFDIATRAITQTESRDFPPSAIPLYVNDEGRVTLPGSNEFSESLLRNYLKESYGTNLAAWESSSTGRVATARATVALKQLDQKMYIDQQELNSIENRRIRVGLVPLNGAPAKPPEQSTEPDKQAASSAASKEQAGDTVELKVAALKLDLRKDVEQHKKLVAILQLTKTAIDNAERVSSLTYDLCQRANAVLREGLCAVEGAEGHRYLISNKYIFTPEVKPIDESDFFEEHAQEKNPWCNKSMNVMRAVDSRSLELNGLTVNSVSLRTYLASPTKNSRARRELVLIDSASLLRDSKMGLEVFTRSPYGGLRMPSGQLFYYSQDGFRSGSAPVVSWSVAIRDLVASKPSDSSNAAVGEPLLANSQGWCNDDGSHQCPGLACEVQLRTPLPVWPGASGLGLTNVVTNAQVQQVPPLPADML